MTETINKILICESCENQFSCGAETEECWCFKINLESEVSAKLRENFQSCLCENCLEKTIANYTNNTNNVFPNS